MADSVYFIVRGSEIVDRTPDRIAAQASGSRNHASVYRTKLVCDPVPAMAPEMAPKQSAAMPAAWPQ